MATEYGWLVWSSPSEGLRCGLSLVGICTTAWMETWVSDLQMINGWSERDQSRTESESRIFAELERCTEIGLVKWSRRNGEEHKLLRKHLPRCSDRPACQTGMALPEKHGGVMQVSSSVSIFCSGRPWLFLWVSYRSDGPWSVASRSPTLALPVVCCVCQLSVASALWEWSLHLSCLLCVQHPAEYGLGDLNSA